MRALLLGALMTLTPRAEAALKDGRLKACSAAPNCVLTTVPMTGLTSDVMGRVRAALKKLPRTEVREAKDGYLRARAKSWLFRFKDDVEFLYDEAAGVLHVRSESRVGYYDFGVNQRRVERLKSLLVP